MCWAQWVISSQPQPDIELSLRHTTELLTFDLELNIQHVSKAVNSYIKEKTAMLTKTKQYDNNLSSMALDHLKSGANQTFFWVTIAKHAVKRYPF